MACKPISSLGGVSSLPGLPSPMIIPGILRCIFLYLNELDLRQASKTCRTWYVLACRSPHWHSFLVRTFPEKERFFTCLSVNTGNSPDWYTLSNRTPALLSCGASQVLPVSLQNLPDAPCPQTVYIDIEGTILAARGFELEYGSKKISLKGVSKALPEPCVLICSIRRVEKMIIALLKLSQKGVSKLIAYDLATEKLLWESPLKVDYVFSGGTNLGLGWTFRATKWSRSNSRERQQGSQESLSPYFFTTSGSTFSLRSLKNPATPLLSIETDEKVQFIDCNKEGDLFVVTYRTEQGSGHQLYIRDGSPYKFQQHLQVLAFDPEQSILVTRSLLEDQPLDVVKRVVSDEGIGLKCYPLMIPASTQYKAQIKGHQIAILAQGSLFHYSLNNNHLIYQGKIVLDASFKKYKISSFTLYDDLLVLLTTTLNGKEAGPLAIFDPKTSAPWSDNQRTSLQMKSLFNLNAVQAIIGREDHVLLCKTKVGIFTMNFRTKNIQLLRKTEGEALYLHGFLITKTPHKFLLSPKYDIHSFHRWPLT